MRRISTATWPRIGLLLLAWTAIVPAAWGRHVPTLEQPLSARSHEIPDVASPWQATPTGDLEADLFADAADGSLDNHSLVAAALVASGVHNDTALADYQQRFNRWVEELRASGEVAGSPRRRAQAVFEFMHRRILRGGYRIECSDLTSTLDEGRYNCVSASVLFCCLAEPFGLEVRGLEVPGHAMSRLVTPDETFDVESTAARWFRLMDDPQRRADLIEKTTGFRPGDMAAAAVCREVSGVELIATIYYNRGVDLLAERQFAQAAVANAKALRLDPSSRTARGNLLATLNNWAIAEGTAGQYAEAAGLLRTGFSLDPTFRSFAVNYVHVHRQWVDALCQSGRYAEALAVLTQAAHDRPDEPWFAQATADIERRWAVNGRQ